MSRRKKLKFGASLTLLLMSLSACSCKINYDVCPVYPIGGKAVGQELSRLNASDYPNTFEWLARINKLRQELALCNPK
ncbi:MAG: hypothetical protein IJS26_01535 [Alphaproteobacteria bacterium]|nr:hypothetical protein [Alphaproteobacteria bacterium]